MKSTLWRIVVSIGAIAAFGLVNAALAPAATLLSGHTAGMQFQNSDTSYLIASYGMGLGNA